MTIPPLFPYQLSGAKWLAAQPRFGFLADEMGLGKSAQAITAARTVKAHSVLVICPAVARFNWVNEIKLWSSYRPQIYAKPDHAISSHSLPRAAIISYDMAARKLHASELAKQSWDLIILDEAHYIKNPQALRTKAIINLLLPKAKTVYALSGTLAPNNPSELWPLLHHYGITYFSHSNFVRRFCLTEETPFGLKILGGKNIPELREMLKPHLLRRTKDQVMKDLPPLLITDQKVPAGKVTPAKLEACFGEYLQTRGLDLKAAMKEMTLKAEDTIAKIEQGAGEIASLLGALQPQVEGLRRWCGLAKAITVGEIIAEELENNAYDKIVIFAVHHDVMDELNRALVKFKPLRLSGQTTDRARELAVESFQNDPTARVFIGQIKAAGIAINLTAAAQVAVVEADWTPATNQQAIMRCHRIGQERAVNVRFFSLAHSVDAAIQKILRRKTQTLIQLFDDQADNKIPKA